MLVFFVVIANEVIKCYISTQVGIRLCEPIGGVELIRLWELGLVEIAFEGTISGLAVKLWRKISDKSRMLRTDRVDKKLW